MFKQWRSEGNWRLVEKQFCAPPPPNFFNDTKKSSIDYVCSPISVH